MSDQFDIYQFLDNRRCYKPITEADMDLFDLYKVQWFVSMAKGMENVLSKTNTMSFFKLPKKYQCLSFESLNGYVLTGTWGKSKKEKEKTSKFNTKEQLVKLLNISENEAQNYIDHNLVDSKEVDYEFKLKFEPESLKVKKLSKK